MRFTTTFLDEIRARLPISEVVAPRVAWDRRKSQPAKGDFWACCPFHQEKTPSFHADDRRGRYHCFSCGASGDHFRFLVETEGVSFPEAVERLAGQAGVPMPAPDPQAEKREARKKSLGEVVELACRYFEEMLRLPSSQAARDYVAKRRLRKETISEFRIGYAPDARDGLKKHLLAQGIDEASMIEAGLILKPEDGRASYDRFRNRLIVPIEDERGRVVAFGGRTIDPHREPKYLNSPETPLFYKSAVLFNLHRARKPAHDTGSVVVVEGYLDAIAVYQSGITSVVATLGTAFTEEQMTRLWRLAPEPVVCFDGDAAGTAAAHRAIDRILPLLKSGLSFNFAFLPPGMDPDDLIAKGGREALMAELQKALPLFDVLWERETASARIDTPERKAALEKRIEDLVATIADGLVSRRYRQAYRVRLSELFWQQTRGPSRQREGQGRRAGRDGDETPALKSVPGFKVEEATTLERAVLGLCVSFPQLFEQHYERLQAIPFVSGDFDSFKEELYRVVIDRDSDAVSALYEDLDPKFFDVLHEVHASVLSRVRDSAERRRSLWADQPILKFHPPEHFVESYLELLLDHLELRSMRNELNHDVATADGDIDPATEARILELSREVNRRSEEVARRERDLAEAARIIRLEFEALKGGEAAEITAV